MDLSVAINPSADDPITKNHHLYQAVPMSASMYSQDSITQSLQQNHSLKLTEKTL